MLVEALRLRNFRNLLEVDLEPSPRFNLFTGHNGQGKTNLLEAVYLLSAVKSFRPQANNAALIAFEKAQASLEARVDRAGQERLVRLEVTERGKRVYLNNGLVRQLGDFFGALNVVVFGPEDIALLKGSPSERRRFLDRAIFNAHPAYAMQATHYEEVLRQRNALLRDHRPPRELLAVYDEQLVKYGADIALRRLEFLRDFAPILERTFREIFAQDFQARLQCELRWLDVAQQQELALQLAETPAGIGLRARLEELLGGALEKSAREERDRGFTVVGPHRDDLLATLNDLEVKSFASQGQHRAFVLAMKIAEITYLEQRYRFAPVLLLDDVSSELDRERNRYLFDYLRQRPEGQVFITSTHRDFILLEEDLKVFGVHEGRIGELDSAA